jgi:hypothetical protein
MRKTQAQAPRSRIGPTSRTSDLVCLLFSRTKSDSGLNRKQAYFHAILGQQTEILGRIEAVI